MLMDETGQLKEIEHHVKVGPCFDRPPYRDTKRRKTAIKAYNISQESTYLLIHGVPQLSLKKEIKRLCLRYGPVEKVSLVKSSLSAEFTETFLVKMEQLHNARYAKRKLDDMTFFGGCLQVTFAPEFETVAECRLKLHNRLRIVKNQINNQMKSKCQMVNQASASSGANASSVTVSMPKFQTVIEGVTFTVVDLFSVDFHIYQEAPQRRVVKDSHSSPFSAQSHYLSTLGKDYAGIEVDSSRRNYPPMPLPVMQALACQTQGDLYAEKNVEKALPGGTTAEEAASVKETGNIFKRPRSSQASRFVPRQQMLLLKKKKL